METGKHYNYFRDYDPSVGRYVESDPLGVFAGLSTYSYVSGNPTVAADPLGLFDVAWRGKSFGERAPDWVVQLRRQGQRLEERIKQLCKKDRDLLQPYFDKWTVDFNPTKINPWTLNNKTEFSPEFFKRDDSYKIFLHEFRHTMDDNQKLQRRSYLGSYLSGKAKDEPDEKDADAFADKLGNTCPCPNF